VPFFFTVNEEGVKASAGMRNAADFRLADGIDDQNHPPSGRYEKPLFCCIEKHKADLPLRTKLLSKRFVSQIDKTFFRVEGLFPKDLFLEVYHKN
jgi:hypothetical protein